MPHRACKHCGETYYVRPSTLEQGFGLYCSKSCSNRGSSPSLSRRIPLEIELAIIAAYQSGASKQAAGAAYGYGRGGAAAALRRHGVVARTVSAWRKGSTYSPEHRAKISANHARLSGPAHPRFGKTPNHARWVFCDHLGKKLRSAWGLTVARALLALGIPHEYEARRLSLGDRTYMPDFYLPTLDLHVEVKGWENARFTTLLPRLAQRPDVRLLIIRKPEYELIRRDVRHLGAMIDAMAP